MPTLAHAQNPFNLDETAKPDQSTVGGVSTIDSIMIKGPTAGLPLRFGGVVPGSERVMLDGRNLRRGVDYSMDNDSGVVYLMFAPKYGQALTVMYRHEKGRADATAAKGTQFGGSPTFRYDVMPGSLGMMLGLGMTERTADGAVLSSNIFGWNNNFKVGGGALKGLFLMGERNQVNTESAFEYQAAPGQQDTGESSLTLQSFTGKLFGGTVQADYQDISKNFAGFGSVRSAGYDQATVDQLTKERGLTRLGFAANDVKIGGMSFSNSYRTVEEDGEGVTWQSFGMNAGGLAFNWSTQKVDEHFTRFKDIAEKDRDQLMREAGMSRERMDGSYATKLGKLSFASNTIEDGKGSEINRQEFAFAGSNFSMGYGTQEIDKAFSRFGSLNDPTRDQWSREAGLEREWMKFDGKLLGAAPIIKFSSSQVRSDVGNFNAVDASVSGKNWSFEHIRREVDSGFGALPNLTQEEIDGSINQIGRMYDAKGVPFRGEERHWWFQSRGLDRDFMRFSIAPDKGLGLSAERLTIEGSEDEAMVETYSLTGRSFGFNYRKQDLGEKFGELTSLLDLERQRLGTLAGLERTDLGFNASVRSAKVNFSQMLAEAGSGTASRQSLEIKDKNLQLNVNSRSVSSEFQNVSQMLDPERDLLSSLIGFNQRDAKIKWDLSPSLKIDAFMFEGENSFLDQSRSIQNLLVAWMPNSKTSFEYNLSGYENSDPASLLFSNTVRRASLFRDMGRYGKLRLMNTQVDYNGTQTNCPDSNQNFVAYETQLNKTTSVRTEHSLTSYDNGEKENISSNTISTALSKNLGVSVTDTSIDRKGDERDEDKRNFGFWWDLGRGIRISYGVAQQQNNTHNGSSQAQLNVTPGQMGDVALKSAAYNVNQWEQNDRKQATTNLSFATAKPLRFGPFKDFQFSFGLDTASDQRQWLRDNKVFSMSTNLYGTALGFDYRAQVDPTGARGIDRTFTLATDKSAQKALRGNVMYKLRTLPDNKQVMIRNYDVTARVLPGLELTNQVLTNPEVARGDVILGSITQGARINRWRLDYKANKDFTVGGTWDELINDDNDALSRTAGLNLSLFNSTGSPVNLFYGMEEVNGNTPRRITQRYSIRYDQKPGPNQLFSIFAGNVSYEHSVADDMKRNNITLQLEYQLRFWSGKKPSGTKTTEVSDSPKKEEAKVEAPKTEATKAEAPKPEAQPPAGPPTPPL